MSLLPTQKLPGSFLRYRAAHLLLSRDRWDLGRRDWPWLLASQERLLEAVGAGLSERSQPPTATGRRLAYNQTDTSGAPGRSVQS